LKRLDWQCFFEIEKAKTYYTQLESFIQSDRLKSTVFPKEIDVFKAFELTSLDKLKVVIIGQDPYHGEGQANGLCFSVNEGIPKPPSLQNIFKELRDDLSIPIPQHGNLEGWAKQGVLMLNATLTARANHAGSHQHKGWEEFTDAVIRNLSEKKKNVVYMLWGKYAQAKGAMIDNISNLVLTAAHPSPLARTGFMGCRHFSKANDYLISHNKSQIDWSSGLH
jgi:uracil-DNA glycosylase